MMNKLKTYMNDNSERLDLYTRAIAKVHSGNHPEVHKVKALYETLKDKVRHEENVDKEFKQLRDVTNHYEVPVDACETYEATYQMLEEADKIYSA